MTEAAAQGPHPKAEEEAWQASDAPPPRPRFWCDHPPFFEWPLVSDQLKISGWAVSQSDDPELTVEIEIERHGAFRAHYGMQRPDVAKRLDAPATCGWWRTLTTSDWEPGLYELTVTARDGAGNETTVRRGVRVDPRAAYQRWLELREQRLPDPATQRRFAETQAGARRLLVLVTEEGAGAAELEATLASIREQGYPDFDVLVSGSDFDAGLRALVEGEAEHAVLVGGGSVLEPHALFAVAEELARQPSLDLVYSDHDLRELAGGRSAPFFKPGWSPELLLSMNYIGPFACVSRAAARRALEVDPERIDGIYGLALRLVDKELRAVRVPDVLWSRTPTASSPREEGQAAELVLGVARRRGRPAQVEPLDHPGTRAIRWEIAGAPLVSIVIGTAFTDGRVFRCLETIRERTAYSNYEVVLVANGPGSRETPALPADMRLRLVRYEAEFNYSAVNNAGARAATGDYLLFLNDDTEVVSPDWIERLLGEAQQPGVGVVGARLLFPSGIVQVGGQVLLDNVYGAAVTSTGVSADDPGYRGLFSVVRNMSSVCGACMLVEREFFAELHGFEEALAVELNDVDLCLRALDAGKRVVFTPHATILHRERASRGSAVHPRDHARFKHRWRDLIRAGDPYYNPNLRNDPDFELRLPSPPVGMSPDGEHVWSERYVPEHMSGLTQAEHEARYVWAARAVAGKEVLDAGCGVGYGSGVLARAAARVVGVDVSTEAIEDARFRAGAEAEFVVGDLQSLPFATRSFDVVVCFEAIEHVADGERVLDELKRVLRPSGVVIVSSPNRGVYPPGNPYHVHEYTAAELRGALAARFRHVALHRQQDWLGTLITDDGGLESREPSVEIGAGLHKVAAVQPGEEAFTLAVAGDEALPELGSVAVLTDLAEIEYWQERTRAWQSRADSLGQQLGAARAEAGSLGQQLGTARAEAGSLGQQLGAAREEALGLRRSLSWRLTAPLRGAHRLVTRRS